MSPYTSIASLQGWSIAARQMSLSKGFEHSDNDKALLLHAEISELVETWRDEPNRVSPKCLDLTVEEEEFADVFIRLVDLAAQRGVNLDRVVPIKMEHNAGRPAKHGKAF